MYQILIKLLTIFLKIIQTLFKSKKELILENISLRQQLSIYQIKKISPKLTNVDRLFWIALKQVWEKWRDHLIIVKPETVIDWQRKRFKKHWTKICSQKRKSGRKRITKEIQDLIYRMTDSPLGRKIEVKPFESANVKSIPKLGGLQHKYEWKQAA